MESLMIVMMFLLTMGGFVMLLTMCAGILSGDPGREGAVPAPLAHEREEAVSGLPSRACWSRRTCPRAPAGAARGG